MQIVIMYNLWVLQRTHKPMLLAGMILTTIFYCQQAALDGPARKEQC
jgi:hypothetical protein